ncbi:MAG: putative chromosome-partitioning protein ParB [Chloroflexi bacterium]|nr:putative chromosome-partitioning protein ParB [Chloroflexota bacterium]
MSKKRPGLGKGLESLLISTEISTETTEEGKSSVLEISVDDIDTNPHQPRSRFDTVELKKLAASIREHGVIQPLVITKDDEENYALIAGERRLKAAKIAGLETVPVIIREAGEQDKLEVALIENVQRTDLNPLETAAAYEQLSQEFGLSHEEIGERVGKSRTTITNTLRLLELAPVAQQALRKEAVSNGHARALLSLPTTQAQSAALQTILTKGLNVRQTEALVKRLKGEKTSSKPKKKAIAPELKDLEDRLQSSLGTKVRLKSGDQGKGTITIHYYSNEELNALLDRFLEE